MTQKNKSRAMWDRAKEIIPGGSQLFSKRPELTLPGYWPAYYSKATGCQIWDLDGNQYTDMSYMGVGSCILGYADQDVNAAVKKAIDAGSMTSLNCPEEVELAQLLCEIHPWADMVRYARTGGESMAIAARLARTRTGKDLILFCGYHGWHDWYLSANLGKDESLNGHLLPGLEPKGVPQVLEGTSIPFEYNDTEGFLKLIEKHQGRIAGVIMEPVRKYHPKEEFLKTVRQVTADSDIVLIFDEITAGWRLNWGGAHLSLGVSPDIAVFAKGMSNGYPMSAIVGTEDVMSTAQDTFISSTYWTERVGPAAALATINKLKENNVADYLAKTGTQVREGWESIAQKNNLKIKTLGIAPLIQFTFEYEKPLALKTLFAQMMLEKGFLASTIFYASYAHQKTHVVKYLEAFDETFKNIAAIIENNGDPEKSLKGPVCHTGFKRLS